MTKETFIESIKEMRLVLRQRGFSHIAKSLRSHEDRSHRVEYIRNVKEGVIWQVLIQYNPLCGLYWELRVIKTATTGVNADHMRGRIPFPKDES